MKGKFFVEILTSIVVSVISKLKYLFDSNNSLKTFFNVILWCVNV